MIIHWDVIQGTETWHRLRYGKIGGSTSKGLFVDSDTLLVDLLAQRLEPFTLEDDGYISDDMQRGIELEPQHRKEMSAYIGMELLEAGWLQSEECALLGISPDGITKCGTVSAELKSPARKKHTETLLGGIVPSTNIHQCLHYFTVNPLLQRHYFGSYRPESKYPFFPKLITRDSPIDLGTKAKPNVKLVSQWVEIALSKAKELESNIIISLNNLDKI